MILLLPCDIGAHHIMTHFGISSSNRYLCDFVYYWSLHCGRGRAAFIHVPASGSLASPYKLVPQLSAIIQAMLKELRALPGCTADCTVDQSALEECSQQLIQHF